MKLARNICLIAILIIAFGIGVIICDSLYEQKVVNNLEDYHEKKKITNYEENNNQEDKIEKTTNEETKTNTNSSATLNNKPTTNNNTSNTTNTQSTTSNKTETEEARTNGGTTRTDNSNDEKTATSNQEDKSEVVHTVTFYINGQKEQVKCSTTESSCKIKAPTLNIGSYEALGWSKTNNSKEAEIRLSTYYIISNDSTLYLVSRKKIDNLFITLDQNGTTIDTKVESCYQYNSENNCKIKSPALLVNANTNTTGWSINKDISTIDWKENEEKDVSSANTYYAVNKKVQVPTTQTVKKVKANFYIQDSYAASISEKEKECYIHTGESFCEIQAPIMTAKENSTIIGWNTDKTKTKQTVNNGATIRLTDDAKFYSITTKKVIITFDKNTTFNNNTVSRDAEGYNYAKENIAAENLSFYQLSCISYNGKGCKIDKTPVIYSTGNEIRGFSLNKDGGTTNPYQISYKTDTTLYARVYNNKNRGTLNTYYYKTLGNVPIEIDKNMSSASVAEYTKFLTEVYNNMPELFNMNGKLTLLLQPTYAASVTGSSAGITGGTVPNILINIPTNKVVDTDRLGTIIHELGHGFGSFYKTRTQHTPMNDTRVINLYNKYSSMSQRPMRKYSYTHINEFYADMFKYYYTDVYKKSFEREQTDNQYTGKTTKEINDLITALRCTARNNYNEKATQCNYN